MKMEELGENVTIVTIFSDDNKKYLSTGLMKNELVKPGFLSTDIKLKSFKAFRRSCVTCCNPSECEAITDPEMIDEINLPPCSIRDAKCRVSKI
jgi:cysteine synthase A